MHARPPLHRAPPLSFNGDDIRFPVPTISKFTHKGVRIKAVKKFKLQITAIMLELRFAYTILKEKPIADVQILNTNEHIDDLQSLIH